MFQLLQYLGTKSNLFLMSVTCKTCHSKITSVGGVECLILLLLELASFSITTFYDTFDNSVK